MTDFAGDIATNGEIDTFTVTLTAGLTYFIEVEGAPTFQGSLTDPVVEIYAGMAMLGRDDDGGVGRNSRLIFTAPATGDFTLAVSGFGSNITGSYQVHVNEDDLRGTFEGNGDMGLLGNRLPAQEAEINYAGDIDLFSTQLVAGLTYAFYMRGSPSGFGTLTNPLLILLDDGGFEVARNDDSGGTTESFFQYTAEYSGTFYGLARGVGASTGTYLVVEGAGLGTNDANFVLGTDGSDNVNGLGGNDIVNGGRGLDRLLGGNGSDTINGGGGGDLMVGGRGNDRYFVDNPNDRVVENFNEGIDTIFATASRFMDSNVENLTLLGTAVEGFGNDSDNTLRGNELDNVLEGGDGDDWIYGGAGNDQIAGGFGDDRLVGEAGFDQFVFNDLFGRDTVYAFQRGVDRLILSGIDANFDAPGNQAFTYVGAAGFSGTAGELAYDGQTVRGDVDGDSFADFEIVISNRAALTVQDFVL